MKIATVCHPLNFWWRINHTLDFFPKCSTHYTSTESVVYGSFRDTEWAALHTKRWSRQIAQVRNCINIIQFHSLPNDWSEFWLLILDRRGNCRDVSTCGKQLGCSVLGVNLCQRLKWQLWIQCMYHLLPGPRCTSNSQNCYGFSALGNCFVIWQDGRLQLL